MFKLIIPVYGFVYTMFNFEYMELRHIALTLVSQSFYASWGVILINLYLM